MFFGVGYKEHLVLVITAPYGQAMFDGTVEILSVSAEKRIAVLMGNQEQIQAALAAWDAEVAEGKSVELGELFTKADVAMLMDNPWKPLLRAPALFITEQGEVKCIPCDEDKPYSLCRPDDEQHATMQNLMRAVQDYDTKTQATASDITAHIAEFILDSINLSAGSVIRYINFKTSESLAVNHGTESITH